MNTPRFDLYGPIHKGLRHFMNDTLWRVGHLDPHDDAECDETLAQLDSLLALLHGHVQHENDYVHSAIEARQPGGSRRTAEDHVGHLEGLQQLGLLAARLKRTQGAERSQQAARLYRSLAQFVAENLEHMAVEESANNALLWALYTDAELHEIHGRILAAVSPDEMALATRWMSAALNAQELAEVFGGMRAGAPREAFEALLSIARASLDARRWAKLAVSLGLAPATPAIASTAARAA